MSDTLLKHAIRCPQCRRVLGESTGPRLFLVNCYVERIVTIHCVTAACHGRVVWRPRELETAVPQTDQEVLTLVGQMC